MMTTIVLCYDVAIGLCFYALGLFFYQTLHFSLITSLLLVSVTLGGFTVLLLVLCVIADRLK